jgi:hypothetical protein
VIGCEYMYTLGPFAADDGWMSEHLNVHPRAVMRRLHFFRPAGQAIFEVFQYEAGDVRPGERIRQEEVAERLGASRLPVRGRCACWRPRD